MNCKTDFKTLLTMIKNGKKLAIVGMDGQPCTHEDFSLNSHYSTEAIFHDWLYKEIVDPRVMFVNEYRAKNGEVILGSEFPTKEKAIEAASDQSDYIRTVQFIEVIDNSTPAQK
jgi:hypothetical protein